MVSNKSYKNPVIPNLYFFKRRQFRMLMNVGQAYAFVYFNDYVRYADGVLFSIGLFFLIQIKSWLIQCVQIFFISRLIRLKSNYKPEI